MNNPNQSSCWVEITNPVHGGRGWSFGSCLWSPIEDKGGSHAWNIMQAPKPGDKIYHFLKTQSGNNSPYQFVGRSIVEESFHKIDIEPPQPDVWKGMSPYYRIPLTKYTPNVNILATKELFKIYDKELRTALEQSNQGQFYVEYGKDKELRMAQAYLRELPFELAEILDEASGSEFSTLHRESEVTNNEPPYADKSAPGTVTTTITRKIRDTKLTKQLKKKHNWKCAICDNRILLPNGNYYAEAHHIRPLGGGHEGLDKEDNIIILCPYHHAEFDYGSIAIDPIRLKIIHIDSSNEFHNKSPLSNLEYLNSANLNYDLE